MRTADESGAHIGVDVDELVGGLRVLRVVDLLRVVNHVLVGIYQVLVRGLNEVVHLSTT